MTIREFELLFRKMYLPLGMYALRIVDDAVVSEDMVQNAFVKTWEVIDGGRDLDHPSFYLYTAVRNECLNHLRRRRETVDIGQVPLVDEETIDTSERDARLWRAIDELPERCRCVFLLSKRDGLSGEEIADQMGISIKTVKNQMTKAYRRLRETLSDGYKPFYLPFL